MAKAVSVSDADAAAMVTSLLTASRILTAITARSLATGEAHELSVPQFRTLDCLWTNGPMSISATASVLEVNPSTAMRMADKLDVMGFLYREPAHDAAHSICLHLTPLGYCVVDKVQRKRRLEIAHVLGRMPSGEYKGLIRALESFARAGSEAPASFLTSL